MIYTKQRDLNTNAAIAEQDRRAAELITRMTVCLFLKIKSGRFVFVI
jgi:hypothetical protein